MSRVSRTYRLDEETAGQVAEIAKDEQMTATEVVEAAIREKYAEKYARNTLLEGDEEACQQESKAPEATQALADVLGLLSAQLSAKDSQLESKDAQIAAMQAQLSQTTAALLAAQESVKAAQALHAIDRKDELLLESDGDAAAKRPWWRFWKG